MKSRAVVTGKTVRLNNEATDAIELFWRLAGEVEPFPRSLEKSAISALPIVIIKLPHLALGSIESWLVTRNIHYSFNCQSRFVRGCLIAYQGRGLLFCDESDLPAEIRFTIAHEVAHFLLDYLVPRENAKRKYGLSVIEVLDGVREPTINERISWLMEGVKIGIKTNLMERGVKNDISNVWKIEDMADRVALELLAPSRNVIKRANLSGNDFSTRLDSMSQMLVIDFGLPSMIAKYYADSLLRSINKGPSWTESIRQAK